MEKPKSLVVYPGGKREEYTMEEYFHKLNLANDCLAGCHLSWNDLVAIATDYTGLRHKVMQEESDLVDMLQKAIRDNKVSVIHSIRSRTKDTTHLVEKIIRKINPSCDNKSYFKYKDLTINNYTLFITDLIGVRLLLRYRRDWEALHNFIISEFENKKGNYISDYIKAYKPDKYKYIAEKPIAYICNGDENIYPKRIIDHGFGDRYRSIHYIIKFGVYYAEIQVRTIFQEGWSEIDHDNRYPYWLDDHSLDIFSKVFSKISAVADEMGDSFVKLHPETQHKPCKEAERNKPDSETLTQSVKDSLIKSNL